MVSGKILSILLIYCGTWFYTIASFYHLSFQKWSFWKSYLLALPLVSIEYIFNIFGNKYASLSGINIIQIQMIIIAFYMMNVWMINLFVIQENTIVLWRELLAFIFLISSIVISSNIIRFE
jgi:hypothetical protein